MPRFSQNCVATPPESGKEQRPEGGPAADHQGIE
jgi:hypothetical protein